jgi:tetratricopeptide (TPR) repeat protein
MREARERGDLHAYLDAERSAETATLERAYACMDAGRFEESGAAFRSVLELADELIAFLNGFPTPAGDRKDALITPELARAHMLAAQAAGARDYALGEGNRYGLSYEAAADLFRESSEHYTRAAQSGDPKRSGIMARRALAQVSLCEGLQELARVNFSGSATLFQRAKATFAVLVEEMSTVVGDEEFQDVKSDIARDATACDAAFYAASVRDQLAMGNAKVALRDGKALCRAHNRLRGLLPPDLPASLRHNFTADDHEGRALLLLATAEVLKDKHDWAGAMAAYERARSEYLAAAEECLKSALPRSQAMQIQLLSQAAFTEGSTRQTEKMRELDERANGLDRELSTLRASVMATMGDHSVNVHTSAQVVATVEQHAHYVQNVEVVVRSNLEELQRLLETPGASSGDNAQTAERVRALLADQDHGPTFLGRVRAAIAPIAQTLKVVGAVAGPIPAIIGAILGLVGK